MQQASPRYRSLAPTFEPESDAYSSISVQFDTNCDGFSAAEWFLASLVAIGGEIAPSLRC
jgi:hypothetical protein